MKYGTIDFDKVLQEIAEEVDRLQYEMNIHSLTHDENIYTYNQLTTVLITLREITTRE